MFQPIAHELHELADTLARDSVMQSARFQVDVQDSGLLNGFGFGLGFQADYEIFAPDISASPPPAAIGFRTSRMVHDPASLIRI
jgi:hypothetical protein